MDDTLCPRCGGKIEVQASDVTMYPQCIGDCGWSPVVLGSDLGWPDDEDILRADVLSSVHHLAHWEPRDRLPTDEEVQALRRRHGVGAGWMIRSTDSATPRSYFRPVFLEGDSDLLPGLRRMVSEGIYRLTCWPVTAEGRPVGWPEVKP